MLKFLCDEMLTGLGRWLRIAGYDTLLIAPGTPDSAVIETVKANKRVFLTCDSELAGRLNHDHVILLSSSQVDQCVNELNKKLHIDWISHAFERCSRCNTPLSFATEQQAQKDTRIYAEQKPVYYCLQCNKLYWEGSHVKRMANKLRDFQNR